MKMSLRPILPLAIVFILFGCGDEDSKKKVSGRWYTPSQVDMGKIVFAQDCASCHGKDAQGTADWKESLDDGSYPPPPLNGSAHTWHHSITVLKRTINDGSIALGGKMPAFKDQLSEEEKDAVIAFFQSKWSSDTYGSWLKRGGLK